MKPEIVWPQLQDFFPEVSVPCKPQRNGTTNGEKKGITLTWSDLTVYIKQTNKKFFGPNQIAYKKIVNNVSGAVESGQLVALMGPSGAGKSTILYALANRHSGGMLVDGDVRLNGKKMDSSMCKMSGLMRQEDLFIGDLTVKEHLMFMARLKLDRRFNSVERENRVCSLIKNLGLSKCAHRKIEGSTFGNVTALSGGERKRLSFATACLPDPPLLFCDEPTTGLDSLNAIRIVRMMASWNATILCTIHQPSPEILKYFSSVILVADGSLVFSGTVENAVDFLKSAGYEQNEHKSAGEFLVTCLAPTPGSEQSTKIAVRRLAHQFALSEYAKTSEMHIQLHKQTERKTKNRDLHDHKSSFWICKFFWLLIRGIIEILRNPQIQWVKIGQKAVVALMAGLCFVGAVNRDQEGLQAVQGALFILVAENTFSPMYSALALLPKEFPLLLRELRDGDYHPSALYLAKIISYIPGLAFEAVLFTAIVYWLANLRDTVFAFSMVLLCNILCVLVSSACGMMFASIFDNYELANIYLIPFDNAMMILSGVYIKLSSLSDVISWLQYFSWLMYSYESMTIIQWQGVKDLTCSKTNYLPCMKTDVEIYEYYSFSEDNLYRNIILLGLMYVSFHVISYMFFLRKIRKHP